MPAGATTQDRASRAAVSQAVPRAGSSSSGQSGSSAATARSQKQPTSSAGRGRGGVGSRPPQQPVKAALTSGFLRAVRTVQAAAATTRPAASPPAPTGGRRVSARSTPAR
ncbi:hypothetical protein ADL29_01385 [Streptomyces chattanoogensis]|uniref:Uncharacterized protein n=1 Tax=Streptomyces chattanoogensis TaxID=66876 RepID=A0A0N0H471_9ACTN|nr:hypothetical protein ADL29_01385 [Streptomyces chattanoogensis]